MKSDYASWTCPFCGSAATTRANERALCDCRDCSCGAFGVAASVVDHDEIIDDALKTLEIQISDDSAGYGALMIGDMRRAGDCHPGGVSAKGVRRIPGRVHRYLVSAGGKPRIRTRSCVQCREKRALRAETKPILPGSAL